MAIPQKGQVVRMVLTLQVGHGYMRNNFRTPPL